MTENSKIEWTDHTFNGWIGCTKVSPACDHCYAENWGKRFGVKWGAGKKRRLTSDAYWRKPLAWDAKAARTGTRPKVFANSLSDVFDAEAPDEWRDRLFALIAITPNLDWLVLTKRPKVARDYFTGNRKAANGVAMPPLWHIGMAVDQPDWHDIKDLPLPNLWLGTTVENQAMADLRIPLLLDTPAAKRFLSCEPLLGPVDISSYLPDSYECDDVCGWRSGRNSEPTECCMSCGGYESSNAPEFCPVCGAQNWDWICPDCGCTASFNHEESAVLNLVIAGGESGKGSRPSHPDWFRGLRDQCVAAGVPFFFKQWGDWLPDFETPHDLPEDSPEQSRFPTCVWNPEDNAWDETNGCWDDYEQWAIADNYQDPEQSMTRFGKKAAGRLLDGREWSEMPS